MKGLHLIKDAKIRLKSDQISASFCCRASFECPHVPEVSADPGVSFLSPFRSSTLGSWIYLQRICFWSRRGARPSCFPGTPTLPPL